MLIVYVPVAVTELRSIGNTAVYAVFQPPTLVPTRPLNTCEPAELCTVNAALAFDVVPSRYAVLVPLAG
jgi:hypothetical protein